MEIDSAPIRSQAVETAWQNARDSGVGELVGNYVLTLALQAALASGVAQGLLSRNGATSEELLPPGGDRRQTDGLLNFLRLRGIVSLADNRWFPTERGRKLLQGLPAALIGYYAEAYGPVLARMGAQTTGAEVYGRDHVRDGEALGRHCEVIFRSFGTELVADIIKERGARTVLDLGCGTGGLVLDLCRQLPELRGFGIDISHEAVLFARGRAGVAGLSDRATFLTLDAFIPMSWPEELRRADFIVAAGAIHEHLRDGEAAVVELLSRYRHQLVSTGGTMLLCEPELHMAADDAEFFLVHVFTAQGFPRPREGWLPLIQAAGLRCVRVYSHPGAGFKFAYYELTAA
ncbi:SAM-dependent methyltransferase [Micromonospora chalcea]